MRVVDLPSYPGSALPYVSSRWSLRLVSLPHLPRQTLAVRPPKKYVIPADQMCGDSRRGWSTRRDVWGSGEKVRGVLEKHG